MLGLRLSMEDFELGMRRWDLCHKGSHWPLCGEPCREQDRKQGDQGLVAVEVQGAMDASWRGVCLRGELVGTGLSFEGDPKSCGDGALSSRHFWLIAENAAMSSYDSSLQGGYILFYFIFLVF